MWHPTEGVMNGVKSVFCKLRLVVNYFLGGIKYKFTEIILLLQNSFCVNLRKVIYDFTLEN